MKRNIIFGLLCLCAMAGSLRAAESYTNAYEAITLFTKVLEQVHRSYVETNESGYDSLIRHALTGMLQDLDPYSQFMDAEAFEDMKDDTSGQFSGIGLVVGMKDGMLTVVSPMEDTPAYRDGFLPGDIIMEIDGVETRELSLSEAVKRMRGDAGTELKLKSIRPTTRVIKDSVLIREEITVASVKDAKLMENQIGYIRVTQFNEPTANDLKKELEKLVEQDMKALVLDLRGNPGGLLTAAAGVAELFLPKGEMIVFTKGRTQEMDQQTFKSTGSTHYSDFPMVILINGGSASASEIVSGALQDHKRAVLVGEKTFGKGCVQSVLQLEDGAAIKLTTAYYYTPSERIFQDHGIEPDLKVEMDPEDLFKLRVKTLDTTDKVLPDAKAIRDTQLDYAIGTLKGMLIQQEWMK